MLLLSHNQTTPPHRRNTKIGAAALLNHCGIETASSFRNSAAYIQSWLRALRNDKRLIVSASGAASKAFDLITGTGLTA